ncbi:MAG: hypothetical protein ACC630_03705 [Nitrospinota bacterium]
MDNLKRYNSLLNEQLKENLHILDLTREGNIEIKRGNIVRLSEISNLRQESIDRIKIIEGNIGSLWEEIKVNYDNIPPEFHDQITAVTNRLREAIEESISLDRDNREILLKIRSETLSNLEDLQTGKRALHGYKSSRKSTAIFNKKV